ncbi:MAG: SRPBCC domain-containing protein [Pirellulales bacterium]
MSTNQERTFRTSRTFRWSPVSVYAAFARPELLAAWWGPDGFTNTFEVCDFQVGGRWKFVMHGPDGRNYLNENLFLALDPGRQVVIRHDGLPYFTLTVELAAVADGTLLTWEQVFDDPATAQAVRHIVVPANEQNLDRLAAVLAQANAG